MLSIKKQRALIAEECGVTTEDVPEIWIARAVANGNIVRFINDVDGGFDVIIGAEGLSHALRFRPGKSVQLSVVPYRG